MRNTAAGATSTRLASIQRPACPACSNTPTKSTDPFEGQRDLGQFGPRIGAAYRVNDDLVVRGAYGLLYAPIGVNYWNGVPYGFAPGFFGTNVVAPAADGSAAFNWDRTPYPGTLTSATKDPAAALWGMVSINPDSLEAGRIQQWNAGVERELTSGLSVGAAYVGNRGTRLGSGDFERNQPDPAEMRRLLLAGTEWNWVSDSASAAAAGVRYPYAGFAGTAWMAITPYPQAAAGFGPLFFVGSPLGRSDYHALQLTANKRSANWSDGRGQLHAVTTARQHGQRISGTLVEWTDSGRDQAGAGGHDHRRRRSDARRERIRLVGPAVRRGPAIPEQRVRIDTTRSSAVGRSPGSSDTSPGLPLAIRSSNWYAGWSYPIYANVVEGVPVDASFDGAHFNPAKLSDPANQYFNPKAFANPAYGELGTGPARLANLRGFGGAYEDLGIIKDIRFGRYTAQVKFELINVLNRHYFADPETNVGSPYFGQVTSLGGQTPRQGQLGVRFQW